MGIGKFGIKGNSGEKGEKGAPGPPGGEEFIAPPIEVNGKGPKGTKGEKGMRVSTHIVKKLVGM